MADNALTRQYWDRRAPDPDDEFMRVARRPYRMPPGLEFADEPHHEDQYGPYGPVNRPDLYSAQDAWKADDMTDAMRRYLQLRARYPGNR
jgi:hypothetical protein